MKLGMGTLRGQLFAATLGAVLLAVGASIALGIVLTRNNVRDTIQDDVEREANTAAMQLGTLSKKELARLTAAVGGGPLANGFGNRRPGTLPKGLNLPSGNPASGNPASGNPPSGAPPAGDRPTGSGPAGTPPTGSPPAGTPPSGNAPGGDEPERPGPGIGAGEVSPLFVISALDGVLPADAVADLKGGDAASGSFERSGRTEIFAAQPIGSGRVIVVARPDVLAGDDFGKYIGGLLIAAGLGALLAAGVAALTARRLTTPIRRVAEATQTLAEGRDPEPLPEGPTEELALLTNSFNAMASQLGQAREAERSVLLSVSHELRTPLTAIRGYAEGIEDGTVTPQKAAEVVGREAFRLERLVGDLLALAKIQQGVLDVRVETVDLAKVATEASERLAHAARTAGVSVDVKADGGSKATADHDRVLQIVTNLVENAIRLTPKDGNVTISTAPGQIVVEDTGPGIPEEDLGKAFERFHLRRRHGRGSPDGAGLGLAIVRDLTRAMGGEVALANRPSGGTRFEITLPR